MEKHLSNMIRRIKIILENIAEEYYKSINVAFGNFDIFKNPSTFDMGVLKKTFGNQYHGIRFLLDMDKLGEYCYEASQSVHINVARELGIKRYIGGVWEYGTQQIYVDINSCTYTKDEDEIESIIYNSKIYRLLNSMYQVDDILIEDTLDDVDESITQNSEEYYKSITLPTSKWRVKPCDG